MTDEMRVTNCWHQADEVGTYSGSTQWPQVLGWEMKAASFVLISQGTPGAGGVLPIAAQVSFLAAPMPCACRQKPRGLTGSNQKRTPWKSALHIRCPLQSPQGSGRGPDTGQCPAYYSREIQYWLGALPSGVALLTVIIHC